MALLLIPGFMLDEDLWRDVVPGLQPFAPIVHADTSRDTSMAEMAARALAAMPGRFAVIGFSMGGYVAREIVRMAPERVSALILIATSARADTHAQTRRKAMAVAQIADAGFRGLSRAGVTPSLHPDRSDDDVLIGRIQAMSARLGGDVFRRQSMLDRQSEERLGEIACPTLIIAARADRLRSVAESEELHAGIAGSEMVIVQCAGHMIPMETPDELLAIIAPWLARATAPGRD
ncbi:alpha/beta fold hydrolase [Tardiphaga sp.]|jgi:pimeloyl-ACP methyl ester carboxylesterase|uniref:alpha/beta fold hydrolase n=1 Tax=Tardiphaga sp. TaxID=1926292 RepID=UPI0037DA1377